MNVKLEHDELDKHFTDKQKAFIHGAMQILIAAFKKGEVSIEAFRRKHDGKIVFMLGRSRVLKEISESEIQFEFVPLAEVISRRVDLDYDNVQTPDQSQLETKIMAVDGLGMEHKTPTDPMSIN